MQVGTKIYYRGDMANMEGTGFISRVSDGSIEITMDDGRVFKKEPVKCIRTVDTGNGMTRFCTYEAYQDYRNKQLEAIRERIKKITMEA